MNLSLEYNRFYDIFFFHLYTILFNFVNNLDLKYTFLIFII